jgi:hypothetical protein
MTRRSRLILLGAALLGVLLLAQPATATAPKKGGSYHGTLAAPRTGIAVTFKVSADGRKVTSLKISSTPIYCSGGGRFTPFTFKAASITNGKFKAAGKQTISEGPQKGKIGAKLSITGKFGKRGTESGKLAISWVYSPTCSGTSAYTTHA